MTALQDYFNQILESINAHYLRLMFLSEAVTRETNAQSFTPKERVWPALQYHLLITASELYL